MAKISVVAVLLLLLATSARADSKFKTTMKRWQADLRTVEDLLAGGKTNDAEWRRIFTSLSADGRDFSSTLGASTAQRRDLTARFARLSAEADSLASAGADTKKRFATFRGECKSCHDLQAN